MPTPKSFTIMPGELPVAEAVSGSSLPRDDDLSNDPEGVAWAWSQLLSLNTGCARLTFSVGSLDVLDCPLTDNVLVLSMRDAAVAALGLLRNPTRQ